MRLQYSSFRLQYGSFRLRYGSKRFPKTAPHAGSRGKKQCLNLVTPLKGERGRLETFPFPFFPETLGLK